MRKKNAGGFLRLDLNKKIVWELLKFWLDMADNYSILVVKEKDMSNITHSYLCRHCWETFDITFSPKDFTDWHDHIDEDAIDYLTDNDVELIMFNRCKPCHDKLFGFTD